MRKALLICLAALVPGSAAYAQINPQNLKWAAGPPGLPKGGMFTVLSGDPAKQGLFTIRARFPAGYVVPPHWHPSDELVTVIKGQMSLGMGGKVDRAKAKTLVQGGFVDVEAKMNHYAFTRTGATIQITAQGPFAITYVNPADDPRRKR